MKMSLSLTQVPVGQRVVIIIIIVFDVLALLTLPSLMLQGDGARLVETGFDVLIAIWHRLVLLDVTLDTHTHTFYFTFIIMCTLQDIKDTFMYEQEL